MNFIKLLIVSFLLVSNYSFGAPQEQNIPPSCANIAKNKCTVGNCETIKSMMNALKEKCVQEQNDASSVKTGKDLSELLLKSDLGYLLAFSRIILSQKTPLQYDLIKKDFDIISKKYNQYLKTDAKSYLDQFKNDSSYYQNETNNHAKNKSLIDRNIKILSFMLESEKSFSLYQETYKKILPDIFDSKKSVKFKSKTFSAYECKFLNNLFDKETFEELKKNVSFSCSEK